MKKRISMGLVILMVFSLVMGAGGNYVSAQSYENQILQQTGGVNQYDTAAQVAKSNNPNPETVLIVRGDKVQGVPQVIDGLTASGLAGKLNAEILLVAQNRIPSETREALQSLKPENVVIIGGTSAVSQSVEDELKSMGIHTRRIFGNSRIETATAVAREIGAAKDRTAVIVDGFAVVDALVAGPVAHNGYPILMVNNQRGEIPEATRKAIRDLGIEKLIIIGGNLVVSEELERELNRLDGVIVEERFGGRTRIDTSLRLAEHKSFQGNQGVSLIDGWTYVDAIAASTVGAPTVYFREQEGMTDDLRQFLNNKVDIRVIGTTIFTDQEVKEEESTTVTENAITTYQTGFYDKENLALTINGNESITVKGNTESANTYAWFQLRDSAGNRVVSEIFSIGRDGRYSSEISLAGTGISTGNENYEAILLMAPERYTTYRGAHWGIILEETTAGLQFKRSLIYQDNVDAYQENNAVVSGDLNMDHLKANEAAIVKELALEITNGISGDYNKVKAVNDWVAVNVYYDYDGVRTGNRMKVDTMSVIDNRIAVCQGYAELTTSLLRSLGIPTRIVAGYALGITSGNRGWDEVNYTTANHAWNEAFVDGRWVIFDPTWNSGNRFEYGEKIKGAPRLTYFDQSLEAFSNTHRVANRQRRMTTSP